MISTKFHLLAWAARPWKAASDKAVIRSPTDLTPLIPASLRQTSAVSSDWLTALPWRSLPPDGQPQPLAVAIETDAWVNPKSWMKTWWCGLIVSMSVASIQKEADNCASPTFGFRVLWGCMFDKILADSFKFVTLNFHKSRNHYHSKSRVSSAATKLNRAQQFIVKLH